MASSLGRIALGVVGAAIGAPFGLSAVGFSIGSAIGGALFAESTNTEGPRLGDTTVSVSSLGKVIPEHWGVTRSSGNVIWSGGLKEVKKTEDVGGKGGGPTSTTYTYFSSFALAIGRGPAVSVRKIWADGKLIYDGTSDSETDNNKYTWRLLKGSGDEGVDPLLSESVNRRLAGLPDISDGNQEESTYTTIDDLIASAATGSDGRSALYADLLTDIKADAESGLATGEVPDYGYTPAYRNIAIILFDEIPLEDFGNRIPAITAEVVWEGAASGNGLNADEEVVPTGLEVSEITPRSVPDGLMAADLLNRRTFAHSNGYMRRFAAETRAEDRQKYLNPNAGISLGGGGSIGLIGANITPDYNEGGFIVDRLLTTLPSGNVVAVGTREHSGVFGLGTTTENTAFIISNSGLEPIGPEDPHIPTAEFGTAVYVGGAYPSWLGNSTGTTRATGSTGETGDHLATIAGNTITVSRFSGGTVTSSKTIGTNVTGSGILTPETGPMTHGPQSDTTGVASFHASKYGPSHLWVGRYKLTNNPITSGNTNGGELSVVIDEEKGIANPFSASVSYIAGTIYHTGTEEVFMVVALGNGGTGIVQFSEDLDVGFTVEIPGLTPPLATSGLTRSDVSNNALAFADGTDIMVMSLVDGSYRVHEGILSTNASPSAQAYYATIGGLLLWEGGTPRVYYAGDVAGASRDHDIAATLPDVVREICERSGMEPDEFDVSGLSDTPVRGYSIARASTGRSALETLTQAFFIDGIETDWTLKFSDRENTPLRTINEDELGEVSGPTGDVNWRESRTPEYSLPSEVNLNYSDPLRDYQTGTAHKRRISNPIPSMYSQSTSNIELAIVMKEWEAMATAERLLYLSWMSRDTAKSVLNWTHADLDPGDVISVEFRDGRIITDRIAKATLGANFEIEMESARSGDPVYTASPTTIIPTGSIPSVNSPIAVPSEMFVFDIPLLYDYHETNRSVARYYTAVGSESVNWSSATIFKSFDGNTFSAADAVTLDATWGDVLGTLGAPRALWTTDRDSVLRIGLAKDRGDIVSVSREDILNGANRALILNRETGIGEVIQFQNATIEDNGATAVLTDLTRGLRGTEYASDQHTTGEVFILLKESSFQVSSTELATLGGTGHFKAVSAGQIITSVPARQRQFKGRSIMPYAPSRLRRTDNGSDLSISWSRRTRVGGGWDMSTPLETVPLSEDYEQYELYLLPSGSAAIDEFDPTDTGSFYEKVVVNSPDHTFSAATLAEHGIDLIDNVNIAVYQISAQVGRGFPAKGTLAP